MERSHRKQIPLMSQNGMIIGETTVVLECGQNQII